MTVRKLLAIKMVLLGVSCLTASAMAEDVLNPSELNLRVKSAEVTEEPTLCLSPEGDLGMETARSGAKLVKVILKGQVARSGRLVLIIPAFAGIYEKPGDARRGVVLASAMCVGEGILVGTDPTQIREYLLRPGSIEITLLFAVPEGVKRFQVSYPAIVTTRANLHDRVVSRR